eukprot:scpid63870/ scgid20300/ 
MPPFSCFRSFSVKTAAIAELTDKTSIIQTPTIVTRTVTRASSSPVALPAYRPAKLRNQSTDTHTELTAPTHLQYPPCTYPEMLSSCTDLGYCVISRLANQRWIF